MSSVPTSETPSGFDADLQAGTVVGEYEIEGKLGQGGFGAVYKATHPLIGKVVAIKVLAHKFSVDPEMVSRFIAEARAVNQIRNRHIIDIFSFGTLSDGRAYYVMEYLEGEPLDALLDREKPLAFERAVPILRAIARALDAAHAKGIAHRDLKPENVFLASDPDGGVWPKLLDFGIAKLLAADDDQKHKTRTGIPIGTPFYMSPEQCRGKDVDHRTDFYAFGVVAYRMLTGVLPFDGDDYMTILMKQINDEPTPPSVLNGDIPPAVDDAIAWLMKKERDHRPPNLVTAMRAIEQAAEASGIAIPRATAAGDAVVPDGVTPVPGALRAMTPGLKSATAPGVHGMAATIAATSSTLDGQVRRRSRSPLLIAAVLGAIAVGAAVFVLVGRGGGGKTDTTAAATPAPAATPAVADASVAVVVDAGAAAGEPPAPPPTPTTVIVTVHGVPDGTEVSIAGTVVGVAPGPVQIPRGDRPAVLTFRNAGYIAVSKSITPSEDQELVVKLKQKRRGGGKRPSKDDIIDVFGKKP